MIFYFSATGNSKYVADKIAESNNCKSVSIIEANREGQYHFESDSPIIGFVFPTYFYGLPTVVIDFLKHLELVTTNKPYIFVTLTFGTTTGNASYYAEKILKEKGVYVDASFAVRMIDTYVPIFRIPQPQKVQSLLKKSEEYVKTMCKQIQGRIAGDFNQWKGIIPALVSFVSYPIYRYGRKTSRFYATDMCVRCGLCESICPIKAIQCDADKPKWIKSRCVLCLGCLHRCPSSAIQYGKSTEKRGRYTNPNTVL